MQREADFNEFQPHHKIASFAQFSSTIAETVMENTTAAEHLSEFPACLGLITERVKGAMASTVALTITLSAVAVLGVLGAEGGGNNDNNSDWNADITDGSGNVFSQAILDLQKYACDKWKMDEWDLDNPKTKKNRKIYRPQKVYDITKRKVVELPEKEKYAIISHTWPKRIEKDPKFSFVEGSIESSYFQTKKECDGALDLLGEALKEEKYVWWDCLCMDRSEMVRMGAFYINAEKCYVFFDPIIIIAKKMQNADQEPWCIENGSLKWFNRVWTLQEMILSKELKIVTEVGWKKGYFWETSKLKVVVQKEKKCWKRVVKRLEDIKEEFEKDNGVKIEENSKSDENLFENDEEVSKRLELVDVNGLKRLLNSHNDSTLCSIRTRLFEILLSRDCTLPEDRVYAMMCLEPAKEEFIIPTKSWENLNLSSHEKFEKALAFAFPYFSDDIKRSVLCAMTVRRCEESGLSSFPSFEIGLHNPLSSIIDNTFGWYGPQNFDWTKEGGISGNFWTIKEGVLADKADFNDFYLDSKKNKKLTHYYGIRYLNDHTDSHPGLRFLTVFRDRKDIKYVRVPPGLYILRARRVNMASVYVVQGVIVKWNICQGYFVALVTYDDLEKKHLLIL
ncbi:hypothetical protein HK096_002704 [Nowakowskiella sp. JEL0078]|nr:hypothetical protein HK096_002704 [Nowakowskiella sp. JEL0078]